MADAIPTRTDDAPWKRYVVVEDGQEISCHFPEMSQAVAFADGWNAAWDAQATSDSSSALPGASPPSHRR